MAKDLTALAIANLLKAPPRSRREVADGKVRGLFLVLQPTGKASWALRYRFDRTSRKLTLGPYPDMDLRAAREAAGAALSKLAQDINPAVLKQATKAAARLPAERELVENVVARFVERYAKQHTREASWRETERVLNKEVVGKWKGRSLADISRADVHALLDTIVDRGSPVLANRALAALRRMCSWAVERGISTAFPLIFSVHCAADQWCIEAPAVEDDPQRRPYRQQINNERPGAGPFSFLRRHGDRPHPSTELNMDKKHESPWKKICSCAEHYSGSSFLPAKAA
jgi:Arm domain-containing DNA-binding protein/integrase-like protein